jgi:hypothetical protein
MIYNRSIFTAFLILLIVSQTSQSCISIYHKQSITIDTAVNNQARVKVVTIDNRKFYFNRLVVEEEVIYGITIKKKQEIKVLIPKDKIKEIHLLNKGVTGVVNFGVVVIVLISIITLSYYSSGNPF